MLRLSRVVEEFSTVHHTIKSLRWTRQRGGGSPVLIHYRYLFGDTLSDSSRNRLYVGIAVSSTNYSFLGISRSLQDLADI